MWLGRLVRGAALAALAIVSAAPGAFAQPAPAQPSSAYVAELDRLIGAVDALRESRPDDASALITALPASWRGTIGAATFDVPTEWLRRDLTSWRTHPTPAERRLIRDHLAHLRAEAVGADEAAASPAGASAALARILATPEFKNVHGQTWLDRLRDRVLGWLGNLFGSALGASALGFITDLIVIGLIVIAAGVVAFVAIRAIQQAARLDTVTLSRPAEIARPASVSFADAERAAAAGDFRGAVHLAYWCGVAFVEARGIVRPDPARTPREFLRLLPPAGDDLPPLRALTTLVERVWYGARPADASSFDEARGELTRLGCLPA
jgi:hypothetical protein